MPDDTNKLRNRKHRRVSSATYYNNFRNDAGIHGDTQGHPPEFYSSGLFEGMWDIIYGALGAFCALVLLFYIIDTAGYLDDRKYTGESFDNQLPFAISLVFTLIETQNVVSAVTVHRRNVSMLTLTCHLLCCTLYATLYFDLFPVLENRVGRQLHVVRYIEWMTSCNLMGALFGVVGMQPVKSKRVRHLMMYNTVMIMSGFLADIVPDVKMMFGLFGIGGICFLFIQRDMQAFMLVGSKVWNKERKGVINVSWVFRAHSRISFIAFAMFPAVFLSSQLDLISIENEQYIFSFADIFTKVILCEYLHRYYCSSVDLLEHDAKVVAQTTLKASKQNAKQRKDFLKYVMHEIRVPLHSLSLAIDSVWPIQKTDTVSISDLNEVFDGANECLVHVTRLMDDVLNLHKMEDTGLQMENIPFDIIDTAKHSIELFRKWITSKNLKIELDLDELAFPCKLMGDSIRLQQVIANFLSNAIKFSSEGSKIIIHVKYMGTEDHAFRQLDVTRRNIFDDKDHDDVDEEEDEEEEEEEDAIVLREPVKCARVYISVQDHGKGMTKAQQSSLFTPYVQINANMNQQGKGTGLGLCICKRIVELCDGEIGVKSTVDVGSEFFATIPFELSDLPCEGRVKSTTTEKKSTLHRQVQAMHKLEAMVHGSLYSLSNEQKKITDSPSPGSDDSDVGGTHVRCLIVDDVATSRKLLSKLLRNKCNYRTHTASNGKQAVELASQKIFQLILMDQQMDIMGGLEATRLLREQGCKAVIIGVTGNAGFDDHTKFRDVGADSVLSKPVKWSAIEEEYQAIILERGDRT